ncbi:hypothetical protein RHSIM_RhsimUnG0128000 [Rhododendron simsii]|uniref:Bifunctional inhibitor/plant lipid transfer protein/seed storage helical domain-containing protein n=1 Tax=Rhododendron simsii TaxID=118357 RepID=A0A834L4S8_RHOSS|nr:hypothetical protein RHSIM_RhsimUnG0128000 [Rhododendron simsii]
MVATVLWGGVAAQSSSSCTSELISMSPCLNYIMGNSSEPSSSCCQQLASVVKSQPQCLCASLNGGGSSMGINVNQTQALALHAAHSVTTPPMSRCSEPQNEGLEFQTEEHPVPRVLENGQGNGSSSLVDVQSLSRQLAQVLSNPEDEAAQELITLMRRVVTPPSTIDVDANGVVHEQVRCGDMPKQTSQQDLIQKRLLQYAKGDKDPMGIESNPFPKVEVNMVTASLDKRLGSTVEKQKQGDEDQMEADEESAKSHFSRFAND